MFLVYYLQGACLSGEDEAADVHTESLSLMT